MASLSETLQPGSNNWIEGTKEFFADPGQLIRDPYDTAAGAGDAAALNFDEGVGALAQRLGRDPTQYTLGGKFAETYNEVHDTSGAGNDVSGSEPPATEGDYSEYAVGNDPRLDARNWVPVEVQAELNKIDAPEGFWTSTEAFQWINESTNLPDVSGNRSFDYEQPHAQNAPGPSTDDTNQSGRSTGEPDPDEGGGSPQRPPVQAGGGGALGTVALVGGGALALYVLWKVVL